MRLGIDWGGTKMEIIALAETGTEIYRKRVATPRDDYPGCIETVADLISAAEAETGQTGTIGLGIPGSISPGTGLVKNANSTWMNGMSSAGISRLSGSLQTSLLHVLRSSSE